MTDETLQLIERMYKDWENIQVMDLALLTAVSVMQ